jgi:ribonuclease-3
MTATPPAVGTLLLEARLGYHFTEPALLELALTHRSWCAEHAGEESNERLEFLGDAVLGMVVTDHLFATWPDRPEGALAKMRAMVVNAPTLAAVAAGVGIGDAVRLGKGEQASGGSRKPSIAADAMEAVFGAVYLDGGMEAARRVVLHLLAGRISEASAGPGTEDHKTQLQELAAQMFEELPVYVVGDEGPDHEKRFFARVVVGGVERGAGEGRSKKQAEQAAAGRAIEALVGPSTDIETSGEDGV